MVSLGLEKELARAGNVSQRAGRGKLRSRRHRRKKSVLVVIPNAKKNSYKVFDAIQGVEAATASQLNISLLAPGAHAGRLTLWTKGSLQEVESRFKARK